VKFHKAKLLPYMLQVHFSYVNDIFQWSYLSPANFVSSYLDGTLGTFDAMVSFSSLEHSGLGRYGDGVHPWGDLVAMSRIWCVLKKGGHVLVGVPVGQTDEIIWNAHK
jgi:hypothetical protein